MLPLRIGLIGAGKHGSRYAHHVVTDLQDQLRLVAVCRRDRAAGEAFARQYGCRYTPEVGALLEAPDIDAVAVVVPPTFHAGICEVAAAAGKAILLEKPAAPTPADVDRIRRALDRHPVPFMVAHTLRFNTLVQTLRARLDDIAPIHSIYLSQRFEPSPIEWLDQPSISGGGIIIHTGVHSFDLLRFLTGAEAQSVFCRTWRIHTRETEDNFLAYVALTGGINATVVGSRSTQSRNGFIEIAGARGQLVGDHLHHFGYLLHGRTRTPIVPAPETPTVREVLHAFADAVRTGNPPPVGLQDGYAAVQMADACYRSHRLGRVVNVGS